MSRRARAPIALALLAGGLASCFSVRWERHLRDEEISAERIASVEPGRSDLAECLASFGAPLYVWELPKGAFSIAYGWSAGRRLGGSVRLPVRGVSASYRYDAIESGLEGLVLVFDRDARLTLLRRGFLREIAPELHRRRPADVEDAEGAAPETQRG